MALLVAPCEDSFAVALHLFRSYCLFFRRISLAISIAIATAICIAVVGCSATQPGPGAGPTQTISSATFVLSESTTPPNAELSRVTVALPDNWSASRRDVEGIGWYGMKFDYVGGEGATGSTGRSQAVLVPRICMNGEIFVNGVRVLSGGRMTTPVTRNWNVPFFVEVPSALLKVGPNQLDIRVFAYRNSNGGIGTVHVGDPPKLRAEYDFLYALHVKGAIISFAIALVSAFAGFVAWLRMNRDPIYGLFGMAMLAWTVRYFNYFVQDIPFESEWYSVIVNSAQGWFFIFFTSFVLRLTHSSWPRTEYLLIGFGAIGTAAIYLAFNGLISIRFVIICWTAIWLPCSVVLLFATARHAKRSRSTSAPLAALATWVYVPVALRDLAIVSDYGRFDASYLGHYVGIPLTILMVWMLVARGVKALREAADAEVARARATMEERQRITQDMHDGLGLLLNSALRLVDKGVAHGPAVTGSIQACLDELRLVVDSSATDSGDFLPQLATLRFRMQPRLEAIGLKVNWRMDDFPANLILPPGTALQILRIVQEAINNTLKHAQASTIEVECVSQAGANPVSLVIRDDGIGFPTDVTKVGNGLGNMKRRALSARVDLSLRSSSSGTEVRIDIPLAAR